MSEFNIEVAGGSSVRLPTAGKYCDRDIVVTATDDSGGGIVAEKDVNFYDYDGTLLHSYTVEEAQALTELPELPTQKGLICQGWNWTLESIKEHNRAVNVGAMYITDDGKTRIYIHLEEERKSPMLGCCPNGTVTVDWGDGTEPDVLTGTSVSSVKWTPTHEYASGGDYVIKLTVDGEMGLYGTTSYYSAILRNSSGSDVVNRVYLNAVKKIELGDSITSIRAAAFYCCQSMTSITIPNGITSIGDYAFVCCYSLASITIPNGVTSIGVRGFYVCNSLALPILPNSLTSLGDSAFYECQRLVSIAIPNSVTSIDGAFGSCYSLTTVVLPNDITSITKTLYRCYTLVSVTIPSGIKSIGANTFADAYGVRCYDFSNYIAVPTLANTNAFQGIRPDCEIRVPAALYDEWIAATNWTTYASQIVAV